RQVLLVDLDVEPERPAAQERAIHLERTKLVRPSRPPRQPRAGDQQTQCQPRGAAGPHQHPSVSTSTPCVSRARGYLSVYGAQSAATAGYWVTPVPPRSSVAVEPYQPERGERRASGGGS